MEFYGYMFKIAPLIFKLKEINRDTFSLLSLFIFNGPLSIYQINKIYERMDKKIAYKNTHKKVQKLISLKLVERETDESKLQDKNPDRGAKYYKLSEEGIFVLFYDSAIHLDTNSFNNILSTVSKNIDNFEVQYKKEIFKQYKNCDLFRFFISPWISIDTIENLGEDITIKIMMFLKNCCNVVIEKIGPLNEGIFHSYDLSEIIEFRHPRESQTLDMGVINEGTVKVEDNQLFLFIRKVFSLESETVKVKIMDRNHKVVIKLDNTELFQLNYKEEPKELDIVSTNYNTDKVSLPAISINEIKTPDILFDYQVDKVDLNSLYFSAVSSIIIEKIDEDDLRLLKRDMRFKKKLLEVYNRLHNNYNMLNK